MTTLRSAIAIPSSKRVSSALISIGTSPKLPNCARAPTRLTRQRARVANSFFMEARTVVDRAETCQGKTGHEACLHDLTARLPETHPGDSLLGISAGSGAAEIC